MPKTLPARTVGRRPGRARWIDQSCHVVAWVTGTCPGRSCVGRHQDVSFESSLQQALATPSGGTAQLATTTDPSPPATNGNNVDTGAQLVAAEQNTLQYQTTVEMLNAQFRLVQGATGGSFT